MLKTLDKLYHNESRQRERNKARKTRKKIREGVLNDVKNGKLTPAEAEAKIAEEFKKANVVPGEFKQRYADFVKSGKVDLNSRKKALATPGMRDAEVYKHENADINENDKLVPIYGIVKAYSDSPTRVDGTLKSDMELKSIQFKHFVSNLTGQDKYSHALISLDDSFTKMYSFETSGFVIDDMMNNVSWLGTESIYVCVMFVKKSERDMMQNFVNFLTDNKNQTKYPYVNLIRAYLGKPVKDNKRYICSAFVGYLLQCSNPKNLHRDYSRLRPEDITILPRSFYVMNFSDRLDFIKRSDDFQKKVSLIYDSFKDEIEEYNNELPRIMLKDRMDKLRTFDKIYDWIVSKM